MCDRVSGEFRDRWSVAWGEKWAMGKYTINPPPRPPPAHPCASPEQKRNTSPLLDAAGYNLTTIVLHGQGILYAEAARFFV